MNRVGPESRPYEQRDARPVFSVCGTDFETISRQFRNSTAAQAGLIFNSHREMERYHLETVRKGEEPSCSNPILLNY